MTGDVIFTGKYAAFVVAAYVMSLATLVLAALVVWRLYRRSVSKLAELNSIARTFK